MRFIRTFMMASVIGIVSPALADLKTIQATPPIPYLDIATAAPVDMHLCLAADVSESVTESEYDLQRKGHAAAIKDPRVVEMIQNGIHGKVAVIYVEWAKQDQQFLGVDWHVIEDTASAHAFAEKVSNFSPPPWIKHTVRNTATSEAIRYCLRKFRSAPMEAGRQVIDLSSDGTNNVGAQIQNVRDEAVSQGVVINALAIINSKNPFPDPTHENPDGGLVNYFKTNVVGGTGSFVQEAMGYESFGEMIKRKFLLELASAK